MTFETWLQHATEKLKAAQVATARLDALVLLEDAVAKDRSWLLAHSEDRVNPSLLKVLDGQITRRARHEPLAYIRGKSEFYGREFKVSPATLQPRPETETMIELFCSLVLPPCPVLADIGTGSGAIIITAELEYPGSIAYATDIQHDALEVAKENANTYQTKVQFWQGDLLQPMKDKNIDVILTNLPYVPDSHTVNEAAMQEPAVALFGGEDGLDLYRNLFKQVHEMRHNKRPAYILTESLPFQHQTLAAIAAEYGYSTYTSRDFIQVFRAANLEALPQASH